MSGGSLWEREHLRPRDLPSLQEVLGACDRSLLRRVIIEDFAEVHACADKARRNAMAQRLDGSLDAMASLEVRRGPTRGWVLAPRESYVLDARGGTLTWRLHAALVPLLNVAAAERLVRVAQMPATTYAQARKVDKRLRSLAVRAADVKGSAGDVDDWGERCYALAPGRKRSDARCGSAGIGAAVSATACSQARSGNSRSTDSSTTWFVRAPPARRLRG